jgi:hypothetical protein
MHPQPSAAGPHWMFCAAQVVGVHPVPTHIPDTQSKPHGHGPQLMMPPHWSLASPHWMPCSAQVSG